MNRLAETAYKITEGDSLPEDVAQLRELLDVEQSIYYLLGYPSGKIEYPVSQKTHPRDVSDNIGGAIHLLAKENPDVLVSMLEAVFQDPEKQGFAFTLSWTLAHLGYPGAMQLLCQGLKQKDQYVRWACCEGLKILKDPLTVPVLNRAALDRASLVRSCAVEALREFGDQSSLEVLKKRLNDPYPGIKTSAQEAIDAIEKR